MQFITSGGKKFGFTHYRLVTRDEDVIAYLDLELKQGLPGVTKGELLTAEEADPMTAIKAAAVAEYIATQKAIAEGSMELGNTKNAPDLKPMSTKTMKTGDASTS